MSGNGWARDAGEWIAKVYRVEPSPFARRVAALLDEWLGLHHMPHQRRTDWTAERWLEIVIRGTLDTFDGDELTRLVFAAHDHAVRVEVLGAAPHYLRLTFSPRSVTEHALSRRHPTLEGAVQRWREYHPVEETPRAKMLAAATESASRATNGATIGGGR